MKLSRVYLFAVAACLGLVVSSCGGNGSGGGETVYLYVTNAYPGASQLTLYGPTGKLISGLEFASRTEEPIEVDRNVNSSDFTLIFDGAPTAMSFSKDLFSMYPQETGTLVISRRSTEDMAEATLYRHVRTPDPDCVMIFGNSLSLSNSLLADELVGYSYQTEWKVDPKPRYDPNLEQFATTRCGYTPVPAQYRRDEVHTAIQNDPWFFPVSANEGGYTLVWGVRRVDPRTGEQRSEGLAANGQIWAEPTSRDFIECLSSAVTVEQEAGAGGDQADQECPTANGTQTGPDGNTVLAENQVVWNSEAVLTCFQPFSYTGFPVEPAQPDSYQAFSMCPREVGASSCTFDSECGGGECRCGHCISPGPHEDDELVCGSPMRVRTPVQDLIFQDIDNYGPGFVEGDGGFIQVDGTFPASEQRFFVVYGRPVNAFVDQWNSEETAEPLDQTPYPGNAVPSYDDITSE